MATAPSLALRALLGNAVSTLGLDECVGVTAGLTPPGKALAAAAVAARSGTGTLTILVVPTDRDVDQLTEDARFFFAALTGSTDEVIGQTVLPLPSLQVDPYRGMTPHFRVAAARARALYGSVAGTARLVVASGAGLLPKVSRPERFRQAGALLKHGTTIEPAALAALLVDAGFIWEDPVEEPGTFAVRGGILDLFPADADAPVRLELVGDSIETLRKFDAATQRSTSTADHVEIVPVREVFDEDPDGGNAGRHSLMSSLDFFSSTRTVCVLVSEQDVVAEQVQRARDQHERSFADARSRGSVAYRPPSDAYMASDALSAALHEAPRLEELAVAGTSSGSELAVRSASCQPVQEFHGRVGDWVADLRQARTRGDTVLFVVESPGLAERTVEILSEYDVVALPVERAEATHGAGVLIVVGALSAGFRLPEAHLQVYVEAGVFEEERRTTERRRSHAGTFLSDLRDLKPGDLVVHVDHGIGEFVGLKQLGVRGAADAQAFLELRYAGDSKLFVPVERLDLVQKYAGGGRPALDKLGGTTWAKAKTRVKKAMRDMAEELLKLDAQRKAVAGYAFSVDTHWQQEFEDAFPFEPTPDQETAIRDIKQDMESSTPMDRLLCGDVGYGKTEVAMRAAFKAVMDGKQVAVLAPTTILAFQHAKTLRERFAGFPITVEMVSRFRSPQEIKTSLVELAAGRVDVIVGTHRLLSKDIRFRDLGLLVVDEEQRFGVAHKERIKQMRKTVDVLTMTATPMPRTLKMSLVGIRDMSIIETPPKDRLSIQTNVVKFDAPVIERAVRNELARGGQVYVVHNRVESIYSIADLLRRLVPEARIVVGHGQMSEQELERAMLGFVERRFDVLLATTIVENGLDIPNANTIIIDRADRYGLAQLYQLRGRVGRSDRPAYAYLLIPPETTLSPVARKRLAAIREFSDLGSGFRVAALDLEIRGAGNLLGGQQSGHIEAVGFEMYVKLLEESISELKGEDIEDEVRAAVNLHVDLRVDETYIADTNQRLTAYRRVAAARTEAELQSVFDSIVDRYGPPPRSVQNLIQYGRVRILADEVGVETLDRDDAVVVIRFRPTARIDPARLVHLVQTWPGATLVPPVSLKLDLGAAGQSSHATDARPRRSARGQSWWTARATTGAVIGGFSKDEVHRATRGALAASDTAVGLGHLEQVLRDLAE